ncbi:MAG: hypothetical protein Q4B58_05630 [Bacteroidales bacterium]|nr:hypothetical protein [Bacteroidales bacterium]
MEPKETNRCSAVVIYHDNDGKEKRQSLCCITAAFDYVQNVVLANNYKFVSIERGFDY